MQNYNAMYMNNPNMYMGGYQYDQSAYMNQYSQGQYNMGYQVKRDYHGLIQNSRVYCMILIGHKVKKYIYIFQTDKILF